MATSVDVRESVRATVYLDHGATSWPKPQSVIDAVTQALAELGGAAGRGTYAMALESSRTVVRARRSCAALLGVADPRDLLFQPGCTVACNLMLKGLIGPGERVVVSSVEHNAVVRPLAHLERRGAVVDMVRADGDGVIALEDVERSVRAAPTRAVVCTHASNVTGAVQPISDLSRIAHEHGALMLVDGAQAAGHLDVDLADLGADAYAVSGHKALLGPPGIGLLYLAPHLDAEPFVDGGTGGDSASTAMPSERPDRYEAGTANLPGIAGLSAGIAVIAAEGGALRRTDAALISMLHEGILAIPGFRVLGPPPGVPRVPVLSAVHERVPPDRIASVLDRTYGIAARAGLHCAPWAHETLGTLGCGAVRFGVGWGNTEEHVGLVLASLREIVRR
ncbi:MAG TPA: aminotransferase class V-fold PLP-dependent enzyme [Coriobacteriia bacterium]|nr:aminotransferase class V-fold PLP-dependent enzyme [Coriobacteriia bacterium]